jgi:hypothetical protein
MVLLVERHAAESGVFRFVVLGCDFYVEWSGGVIGHDGLLLRWSSGLGLYEHRRAKSQAQEKNSQNDAWREMDFHRA